MNSLTGIFPALLTPFKKDNRINERALQQLVQLNLAKGVSGFYVGGSTSEAFLLSLSERKYILDIVKQECQGKGAIIYHVGSIGTGQAIELAQHAEQVGVDAISAVPPFYYQFTLDEVKSYYTEIIQSVSLPMILYNFPAFSGVTFNLNVIAELFGNHRFIGLKHTSSDFYLLERVKQLHKHVLVYNGYDEMFLAGLGMGADGGIGSTYNFMAEKFIRMQQLVKEGKWEEAREVQNKANQMIAVLIKVGVFQGEKEILNQMGLDFGICRSPFKPLTAEAKEMLKLAMAELL